jgi:hypothetical protein
VFIYDTGLDLPVEIPVIYRERKISPISNYRSKIPVTNCGIGVFYDTGLNLPVKIPVINCGIGVFV